MVNGQIMLTPETSRPIREGANGSQRARPMWAATNLGTEDQSHETVLRRLNRLREELDDAGAALTNLDDTELLAEIDRARSPKRHERRFPSYGAIVCGGEIERTIAALDDLGAVRLAAEPSDAAGVRQMADGVQSFAFIRPGVAELVLLPAAVGREAEAVRFRRALGRHVTLVRRSPDGSVSVLQLGRIVLFEGTRWWVKTGARDYTLLVHHAVPAAPLDLTEQIMDFCVHSTGPAPGGTILVWCLQPEALTEVRRSAMRTQAPLPFHLPLTQAVTHSAATHLLTQYDGAALLNPEGDLIEIGVHLRPSARSHRKVEMRRSGGTRHAAAQRNSYDLPGALFFVVSDDGPVTVYHRGQVIAATGMAAGALSVRRRFTADT